MDLEVEAPSMDVTLLLSVQMFSFLTGLAVISYVMLKTKLCDIMTHDKKQKLVKGL